MKRIYLRRDEMINKCNGRLLCFKIQDKLDKLKDSSRFGQTHWDGGDLYGVDCSGIEQHVVDLRRKICSCRKWQLTGIPCCHGISAIYMDTQTNRSSLQPEEWVDPCYTVDTFTKIYSNLVHPIRDPEQWPVNDAVCNPPIYETQRGRRQTKRRKGVDETPNPTRISKRGAVMHCTKCKGDGHNRRNCSNLSLPTESRVRRPRGRPVDPNSVRQRGGIAPSLAGRGRSRGNQWRAAWRSRSTNGPTVQGQTGTSVRVQQCSQFGTAPGPSQPSQ